MLNDDTVSQSLLFSLFLCCLHFVNLFYLQQMCIMMRVVMSVYCDELCEYVFLSPC